MTDETSNNDGAPEVLATEQSAPRPLIGLKAGLERHRNRADELVLIDRSALTYMGLQGKEEPILEFLDGSYSLDRVVAAGLELERAVRPMAVLALLRRLHRVGMLQGLGAEGVKLFGPVDAQPGGLRGLLGAVTDIRLQVGPAALALVIGKVIPSGFWRVFHVVAGFALLSALGGAIVQDMGTIRGASEVDGLLSLFPQGAPPLQLVTVLYGITAALLTWRGLLRGLLLMSQGVRPTRAGIRIVWGFIHLDIDDSERRAAPRATRLDLALVGLSSIAFAGGLAGWIGLLSGNPLSQLVSAVSWALFIINVTPYAAGDGREVAGIATRIPSLRRRSWAYLKRRAFQVKRSGAPPVQEALYVVLACVWITHGLALIYLVGEQWIPGLLDLTNAFLTGRGTSETPAWLVGLGIATTGMLFALMLGIALWFIVLVGSFLNHLVPKSTSARRGIAIDQTEQARFAASAQGIPFLASLTEDDIKQLAAKLKLERYKTGEAIIRQGEPGDRFCFIQRGNCTVAIADVSGLDHEVAQIGKGDFFGEVALVQPIDRTATVRAQSDVEVLSLAREEFLNIAEKSAVPTHELLAQIRNAAFIRNHRFFATLAPSEVRSVLQRIKERKVEATQVVVQQGEEGNALFLIREGTCDVEHTREGATQTVAQLSVGDHFGEIALMAEGTRTATVRATQQSVLLEIPDALFKDILLKNFDAVVQLDRGCTTRLNLLQVL